MEEKAGSRRGRRGCWVRRKGRRDGEKGGEGREHLHGGNKGMKEGEYARLFGNGGKGEREMKGGMEGEMKGMMEGEVKRREGNM